MSHHFNAAPSPEPAEVLAQRPNEHAEAESSQGCIFTNSVYPWWEEQQCVLDSESAISDLDHSIKEQLRADGWLLDRSGQEIPLSPFPPDIDSVILARSYITTLENWLRSNVEDPEEIIPVDGDIDP
ncbi:hypothetical protein N7481_010263 [Penicillium waksmanii]|uniref:uncharacterized protein n=1 Tax=Penicillium waksmanii TaxID=69791 RepID=UPI0025470FD2|nr:uncharacterized protein N7481_010263 [Penicillium waksmanii]KAJ5976556.1 hypothetical protein N7481_010263 [Penicillium waksmanii]